MNASIDTATSSPGTAKVARSAWSSVPILMYHAVEDHPRAPKYKHFYVTKGEFAWQMRRLKQCGYSAITFDTLASARDGSITLPARPVLLTFDDGYANLLTNVEPLLRDLGWPYTVFLVSDLIGKTNDWVRAEGYDDTPLLTWDQIHSMARGGLAQFHAHTKTHPKLADLAIDDVRRELTEAKDTLERNLGRVVDVFCYPYGSYNGAVVDAVREAGYKAAVTTDFGRVRVADDPLRLPRISVYHVPPISLTYGVGTMNFDWRLRTRKDRRPMGDEG